MKQLVLVCVYLACATQAFSQLTEKQLEGNWNYSVVTDQGTMTGVLNFSNDKGVLTGKVLSDDGQTWNMNSLEILEENTINFKISPQGETFSTSLIFNGNTFTGTSGPSYSPYQVSGERQKK
ncbi:MAG: hypothetical protein ABJJ05_04375 [Maribacter litoralis]|uniref:hypothetical protein n=1 Tax=Maribacter litoralis TaxID=2059726 RepID=UPI003297F302